MASFNKKRIRRNFLKRKNLKNSQKESSLVYDLGSQPKISSSGKKQGFALFLLKKLGIYYRTIKEDIVRKKKEKLTVMLVPHNQDKIKNFNISNLTLIIVLTMIGSLIAFGSILIINHTSTVQEMDNLRISQKDSKIQFAKIREEIIAAGRSHEKLKKLLLKIGNLTGKKNLPEDESFTALGGLGVSLGELDKSKLKAVKEFENQNPKDLKKAVSEAQIKKIPSEEDVPYAIYILNRLLNDVQDVDDHLDNLDGYIKRNLKSIRNSPTLWPVKGYIINPYGFIRKADQLKANFNTGVDIVAFPGAKVVATAPGYLKQVTKGENGLFTVKVRHHYGYETVYSGLAHLSVEKNAALSKGEEIGYLGLNGSLENNTLHYEIYIGIEAQNPLSYLTYPKE